MRPPDGAGRARDAAERVVGTIAFTIDHAVEGMAHGRIVRSPFPHAAIRSVDTSDALASPGVVAVVTGEDIARSEAIPNPHFGLVRRDQPPLAIGKARYAGEPVALVVAETERDARRAAALVDVDYEELDFVETAAEASRQGAAALHERWPDNACGSWRLRRGDPDAAWARAELVVEGEYTSPAASPQPLEPHVVVASPDLGRGLRVWSSTQWPSAVRGELAHLLGLDPEAVRVQAFALGGGFGAKGQVKLEPLAASAAVLLSRPVRIALDRDEVFLTVCKHPATMRFRTGVDADGTFLVRDIDLRYDAGAYAVTSPSATGQALVRSPGPYRFEHASISSSAWYTNAVPSGSFRGAMTNQVAFAYESHVDEIAAELGMDPVALRRRNHLRDGDRHVTGETLRDVHFEELLDEVAAGIGWDVPCEPPPPGRARGKGVAVILKSTPTPSRSEAEVELGDDGAVIVYSSGVDMGQGFHTAAARLAAGHLGISEDRVTVSHPDTAATPFDAMSAGSRLTHVADVALGEAAAGLRRQLSELAARQLEADPADLLHEEGCVVVAGDPAARKPYEAVLRDAGLASLSADGAYQSEGDAFADPGDVRGVASAHWHQGAVGVEVEVDLETGRVEVRRCHGASFAGRVVDPMGVRQQNEGSIIFGIGPALFEQLEYDSGQLVNPNLSDYMIPSILDIPTRLTSAALERAGGQEREIHGVGEMTIPAVAPAIANALERAAGVRIRDLPLTAERVLRALEGEREGAFDDAR